MEAQDFPIAHFEHQVAFARALKVLPAQILEHSYSYETFGSWHIVLKHKGVAIQVAFDGRDRHLGLARSTDRNPPYRFGAEQTIESGAGENALDSETIERLCRAIAQKTSQVRA